jgi:RluA family pseudouridine synthase
VQHSIDSLIPQRSHVVPQQQIPVRLIDYAQAVFSEFPSRKSLKKALIAGLFLVDGVQATTATMVQGSMQITLCQADVPPPRVYEMQLEILYEDEYLAAIFKPAGIEVSGNKFRTIANALPGVIIPSTQPDALRLPWPVHRLDFATSGLLLVAKTRTALAELGTMLQQHRIHKRYRAVVMGKPAHNGEITTPINGQNAHTSYSLLHTVPSLKSGTLSLLDVQLHTGRTHQIRIHLASQNTAILGDGKYGPPDCTLRGKGLFLCAVELAFTHPITGKPLCIQAPQPVKFDRFMNSEARRWARYHQGHQT